ncbi:MAG: alpha-glucosidase [Acidobacteriota bacterium]|nr:alpha-glucosidase [Acidobacteriota bacterium]
MRELAVRGMVAGLVLGAVLAAGAQATSPAGSQTKGLQTGSGLVNGYQPTWWKSAVVYQVYPRSFQDSNGDGIGDLRGITARLDYLHGLGVDVLWLSPHYDSPNADNGYDIRDYRKVMTEFGTMADFDALLAGIKARHMKLIIDLVVNHTSDEHHWFVESRQSKNNPYRDYYIWRPGKVGPDGKRMPPNNYRSAFSGSAWQYDPQTGEYYLHLFAIKQPDLNWENPKVRQEVYSLMRFWLDKGVDGFRMDVIPYISKQPGLPDLTPAQQQHPDQVFGNGPRRDEFLQEMNREVLSHYDVMSVGEAAGVTLAQEPALVDDRRHELNMIFNFDAVRINRDGKQWKDWTLPGLKAIYAQHAAQLDTHSWDTVFLSNHDNPRLVSSFGDDRPEYRVASAKLLATMLMTLRGTPFVYQGDELGMTNYPFQSINEYNDIEAKNGWQEDVLGGHVPAADYLANLRRMSRDNARTPMQWDATANGGFTTAAKPWLAVNPNFTTINASAELADPDSVYHYYAQAIALHHRAPALVYGDYRDLDPTNPQVFAYTRTLGQERYLVVLNFSEKPAEFALPPGVRADRLVLGNLHTAAAETGPLHLQGWEARVYQY